MDLPAILSLASGGGGLDIGIKRVLRSARTICYVENEVTAAGVLVEAMRSGLLDDAPVWTDLRSFDARPWRGLVDGVIGGYPCQPFSVAGKQLGADDPRHLWPYIADIIRAVEPRWCFFENVAGHLRLGFREVAEELRGMGYKVAATLWQAEEVGAPHRRERLYIMAHTQRSERERGGVAGELGSAQGPQPCEAPQREWNGHTVGDSSTAMAHAERTRWAQTGLGRDLDAGGAPQAGSGAVGDTDFARLEGRRRALVGGRDKLPTWPPGPTNDAWASIPERYWPATPQPAIRGVVDGLGRADWIRILGNGVVPQQAEMAFRELAKALCKGAL